MRITDREILEARDLIAREIEAGRIGTSEPLSDEDVNREIQSRKRYKKAHRKASKHPMLPGEIPLGTYVKQRAAQEGRSSAAMFSRLIDSNYYGVPIRRVNARVVFVQTGETK